MSAYDPPLENVPIFDAGLFTPDTGGGLSQAQANALYLRKTVPDTATALETFTAGIVTPSVTSTGALNIVVPAAVSTDTLNVGVVTRGISGQIHHYSDGDNCVAGAGVHINNGINNGSNTNVMNGTNTTGQLNLMTGGNATGTVNIMTAASSGNVNIKTGNNSTGTIAIGQQNATSFTTTTIDGDVNIASQTGADNTINIGKYGGIGFVTTTNIDGNVNIGLTGGEINAQNLIAYTLTTDTIFGPTTDAFMEIGRDITTGPAVGNLAIAIGQELTTGKVEIGKNQTTGTIALGSATTVVSTAGKLQTQFIRAPTTAGITYINDDATGGGGTVLGSTGTRTKIAGILETSSIRTPATNGSLAIAGDQTSGGTVNIGTVFTTTTFSGPVQATGLIGFAKTGSVNTFTETNTFTNATAGIKVNKITSDGTASSLTIAGDQTAGGTVAIGSASTVTTMNGATTVLGTTNINATGGANTTIGTVVTGTTTLRGSTVDITCSTLNLTGGTTVVGTTNINTTGAQSTAIGNTTGTLTSNGSVIKQITPLLGSGTVEVVYGNANNVTSLSTTFNRKRTVDGGGGSLNAIDCYTIANATQTFTSQYFEIIISGSNLNYGGYSYKGCFSIYNPNGIPTPSSVTTLYSANGIPTVTLVVSGTNTTVRVQTNLGGSTNQNFMTTLIGYPTLQDNDTLLDFAITAI